MSWKIKIIRDKDKCPDKDGGTCLSKKRIYYRNPTVSHKCREDKCPRKVSDDNKSMEFCYICGDELEIKNVNKLICDTCREISRKNEGKD